MPGSRGRWARLALAGLCSASAPAHVLPRRRSGALCLGSGAGQRSKHLAGFPSQARPRLLKSREGAYWPAPPHHFGEIRLLYS